CNNGKRKRDVKTISNIIRSLRLLRIANSNYVIAKIREILRDKQPNIDETKIAKIIDLFSKFPLNFWEHNFFNDFVFTYIFRLLDIIRRDIYENG
ncbi:MAG: hypothetical protein Q6363_002490, partial [Candidatus Njordarchaeota archaeon]